MRREQCPSCAAKGGDTDENNLARYPNGSAHCFACGYHEKGDGTVEETAKKVEFPQVIDLPKGLPPWKLKAETCERYGVKHIVETNGEVVVLGKDGKPKGSGKIFFPLHDYETMALIGYVSRQWDIPKKDGMRTHCDKERMSVFGLNAQPKVKKTLIICEGITDTLTVAQEVADHTTGVLGVLGTDHAIRQGIPRILQTVYEYNRVYLCLDSDEPGQKALKEILPKMPMGKTYVVTMPLGDDPNSLLCSGRAEQLRSIFQSAKQYVPDYIVPSEELVDRTVDYFFDEEQRIGISTGYPPLDELIGGYAPGKMVMIAAPPKNGKTATLMNLAYNCYKQGIKQLFIPLEMTFQEVVLGIASIELGIELKKDKEAPTHIQRDALRALLKDIADSITFVRDFGSLTTEELRDKCYVGIDGFGARIIWLDHITAASVGMDTRELDEMVYMLKGVAKDKEVTMVVVTHVNGVKEFKKVQYTDLRNSKSLAQVPDVTIAIMRLRERGQSLVYTVTPDRFIGEHGEFKLYYKHGRFTVDEQRKTGAGDTLRELRQSAREVLPPGTQDVHPTPRTDSALHLELEGVRDTERDDTVDELNRPAEEEAGSTDKAEHSPVSPGLPRPEDRDILRDEGTVTARRTAQVQSSIHSTARVFSVGISLPPYSLWEEEMHPG